MRNVAARPRRQITCKAKRPAVQLSKGRSPFASDSPNKDATYNESTLTCGTFLPFWCMLQLVANRGRTAMHRNQLHEKTPADAPQTRLDTSQRRTAPTRASQGVQSTAREKYHLPQPKNKHPPREETPLCTTRTWSPKQSGAATKHSKKQAT